MAEDKFGSFSGPVADWSGYRVGFAIRIHYPGVESLKAWSREVR